MNQNTRSYLMAWLSACAIFVLIILVLGGIVRLTRSGLSIVEWKPVTGWLPPLTSQEWSMAFEKYKNYPEYKHRSTMDEVTLEQYKVIYKWEFIHRFLGKLLGLVFIIPFLGFVLVQKQARMWLMKLIPLLFLGMLQGFLGWYMVKSGLVNQPAVSHYRLAMHLSLAYIIFSYLIWTILSLKYTKSIQPPPKLLKFSQGFLMLVILQIFWGVLLAGLKGGYIYNTFPLMGNQIIPNGLFSLANTSLNFVENPVTVQFIHRVLGILIFLKIIFSFFYLKKYQLNLRQSVSIYSFLMLGILQVCLGIITLVYGVPIIIAVLHQVIALCFFSCLVAFLHSLLWEKEV